MISAFVLVRLNVALHFRHGFTKKLSFITVRIYHHIMMNRLWHVIRQYCIYSLRNFISVRRAFHIIYY